MVISETAEEKYKIMTETPTQKLVCTLAVPTIVSMMIMTVYNMTDAFYVSQLNTSASGAVGVAYSFMLVVNAVGYTLGVGGGSFLSRLLGQKNREYAEKVAATAFYTGFGIGILLMIFGLLFLTPLVYALGATETIAPYAEAYIKYILFGTPFMICSIILNVTLRLQGSAFFSMIGLASGSVLNIALAPLFIFTFGLGIRGAAIATIISQFVGFCILYYSSGIGGNIKIRFCNVTLNWAIYKEILRSGMPSFYRQGLSSVSSVVLNFSAGQFGDAAISAMTIVMRVFQFATSAMFGFGQGFQPVCGFNYGAKRFDRVRESFWFCVKLSTILLFATGVVGFLFSPQIISVFRRDDANVIAIGAWALRFQFATLFLSAWITFNDMMFQTIGKGARSSVLAVSRQGLFFIPALLVLPHFFGILGIQLAQSAADILSFILATPLGINVLRELKQQQETGTQSIKIKQDSSAELRSET